MNMTGKSHGVTDNGQGLIWFDGLQCIGNELRIGNWNTVQYNHHFVTSNFCTHNAQHAATCTHDSDIGIGCDVPTPASMLYLSA